MQTTGGRTHNAWYWPAAGYVLVGEESSRPGVVHVVGVGDLSNPVEVATFGVNGETPHNFWLDEAREILYVAWYSLGLRATAILASWRSVPAGGWAVAGVAERILDMELRGGAAETVNDQCTRV